MLMNILHVLRYNRSLTGHLSTLNVIKNALIDFTTAIAVVYVVSV